MRIFWWSILLASNAAFAAARCALFRRTAKRSRSNLRHSPLQASLQMRIALIIWGLAPSAASPKSTKGKGTPLRSAFSFGGA